MINRIFFISENVFTTGDSLPVEENIYFSVPVDPSSEQNLAAAYELFENSKTPAALLLDIRQLPGEASLRFTTSFLFFPAYLRIDYKPVINLKSHSKELLEQTCLVLKACLQSQGINDAVLNNLLISHDGKNADRFQLFDSQEEFVSHYGKVLESDKFYNHNLFFYSPSVELIRSTILLLKESEAGFQQRSPQLFSLVNDKMMLEKEIVRLNRKLASAQTEMTSQRLHSEILRSGHSTKALQDYYDQEYEILPTWYKRFGHILKVIMGKRTFRSLFKDDVKKYTD